jgi:hypothetical protein
MTSVWKSFSFFSLSDQITNESSNHLSQLIKSTDITCSSNGRGLIVLGDSDGFVHVVEQSLFVSSFPAYAFSLKHIFKMSQSSILVTVGSDESVEIPLLKVWDLDKNDKSKNPLCLRIIKIQHQGQNVPVETLNINENLSLVSLGLSNGSVILIKGDIAKERLTRQKVIDVSDSAITGLGTKVLEEDNYIVFITTSQKVFSYRCFSSGISKEFEIDLGCKNHCCTLDEKEDLVVGRNEAVYYYSQDGRGSCFILEGEKVLMEAFKNYVLVVLKENGKDVFKIYDLKNKFIAFSSTSSSSTSDFNISIFFKEWGCVYFMTQCKRIFKLEEKEISAKFDILFKKNLYPLAISLSSQDPIAMNEVFKKFGDYLYDNGDYDGSMQQYICTVGNLEPSYVIRKFLDAQRIQNLILYLQTLHEKQMSNPEHTSLLLNCYTKLGEISKLEEFIKVKNLYLL